MQVLILTQWSVPVLRWLTSLYTIAYNVLHLPSLSLLKCPHIVLVFVTKDVKSGQSPLMHAVESGNAEMVHFLIEVMRMCGHWGKTCDSAQFNIYATYTYAFLSSSLITPFKGFSFWLLHAFLPLSKLNWAHSGFLFESYSMQQLVLPLCCRTAVM